MTHGKMETNIIKNGLTKVIKRPPVDIQFENISYSAGRKPILRAVSGRFRSGNLIGILGSSGAGKTTLLNVLAGHLQNGVSGEIYINDELRVMKKFHKMKCYITQEDVVQPYLTVMESIKVASNLKLDDRFSEMDKELIIEDVLSAMGLATCVDTRVEDLSGGQRKRLIIALEFISNPQIIFLDEPTTGLDDFALRNCIHLLKSCALQGRTIVCTIHQPSDSLLKLFDSIYVMAGGNCIYNGTVPDLVQFLSNSGYVCPTNYNPADYIIEISHFDYFGMLKLKDSICNGKTYYSENEKSNLSNAKFCSDENENVYSINNDFPISFWRQFSVLTKRKFLQMKRNKLSIAIAFGVNIIIGVLLGLLFYEIGMKGSKMQANIKYFYCIVMHFLFTYFMVPILLYPFEIKLLEREYFNRWYSLKAYYLSSCVSILPVLISSTAVFVVLVYILTGQPLEWNRFLWFTLICMLTGIASQRLGYVIGTLFNPTEGVTVGSILISFLTLISIYNAGHGNMTSTHMNILSALSFPYHAFVGIGASVLEHRGTLNCDEIVCYLGDADFVMHIMGWEGKTTAFQAFYLLLFTIFHQVLSYFCLKIRVAPNLAYIRNLILSFKL